jgi:hypothetical protein
MFNIQFNFNPDTQEILNLRVVNLNKDQQPYVKIEDNKLVLTQDSINLLNVFPGERITINYYSVSPEETFPVIAKSEFFTDATGGCKLTKHNTVSFKGNQRETLMEYGDFFKLEPFKKWFKMIPVERLVENDNLIHEEIDLKKLK